MNKETNKILMGLAERELQHANCLLFKEKNKKIIYESYNGQVSALGVSILMIGLKPALAVYYQDVPTDRNNGAFRKNLLEVIVGMLVHYRVEYSFKNAESMMRYILDLKSDNIGRTLENKLKTDILNCSVALKQVIRTYKLE